MGSKLFTLQSLSKNILATLRNLSLFSAALTLGILIILVFYSLIYDGPFEDNISVGKGYMLKRVDSKDRSYVSLFDSDGNRLINDEVGYYLVFKNTFHGEIGHDPGHPRAYFYVDDSMDEIRIFDDKEAFHRFRRLKKIPLAGARYGSYLGKDY
ncbi:MAG: hypothetical protein MRY32_02085 [Rickettsiales bacterium]|nr:hypothetical protein [Rickettsiales bacterium]